MLLNVFAKKVESKEKVGKSFFDLTWKHPQTNDYIKVKFKQEAGLPSIKDNGYYLLDIEVKNISLQTKKFVREDGSTGEQTIIWVAAFSSCIRNVEYEEKLAKEQKEKIAEMFKVLNS